jgi:hypothetical protein
MATTRFKSANSYHFFERQVLRSARYVRDTDTEKFLSTLLEQGRNRIEIIPEGSIFWRAQVGHELEAFYEEGEHVDDVPCPFFPERMKPPRDRAREGRANPKGIPYLYGASCKETAMAEVRPWLGAMISVGQFKMLRSATVVNCSSTEKPHRSFMKGIPKEDWDKAVWWNIDHAFAKPVSVGEDTADYVPTQIIADLFKVHGVDVIVYRSAFRGGDNLVLFDVDSANLINQSLSLFETKNVDFEFQQVPRIYSFSK